LERAFQDPSTCRSTNLRRSVALHKTVSLAQYSAGSMLTAPCTFGLITRIRSSMVCFLCCFVCQFVSLSVCQFVSLSGCLFKPVGGVCTRSSLAPICLETVLGGSTSLLYSTRGGVHLACVLLFRATQNCHCSAGRTWHLIAAVGFRTWSTSNATVFLTYN
jgi:hypothetical protein